MRGRTIVGLILMCMIFAQACRKDRGVLSETEFHSEQLIQQTDLKKWFETNKSSKLLKLDWTKARQGTINGKNVVRIPTITPENNLSAVSVANLKDRSLSSKGLSTGIANNSAISDNKQTSNYNPIHPPELFFIQDGPNGKLHSYLLNFLPKERNKENGNDKVWTGKLLEWNVRGDTVLVQELERNKVKTYYAIKPGAPAPSNLSDAVKNNKLQSVNPPSIKDKQVSGFFGWLIDKLGEFAGWVGDFFGLSVYNTYAYDRYNDSFNTEYQLNINFDWLTGSGGPPADPGETTTPTPVSAPLFLVYTAAGEPIYESYISGYVGGGTGGSGTGGPNTEGPDIYHPYPVWNGESIDGSSSGGPNFSSYNLSAQYMINQGWVVGGDNIEYVNSHKAAADALVRYIDKISIPNQSDIDFLNWSIQYLNENPDISLGTFIEDFLGPNVFSHVSSIPSNVADDAVIQNGISVSILPELLESPVGALLARTTPRNNTEDMTYGTNADFRGIIPRARTATTEGLFLDMRALLIFFTTNDHEMQNAALDFLEKFKSNTGGVYSHRIVTNKVIESSAFKNFTKKFGDVLNNELRKTSGNINGVSAISLGFRPSFSSNFDKLNGLTILINDTEKTDVNLESYSISNGHWVANVLITIADHFGLDKHDALKYQSIDSGFAAWWTLQHDRNYKPFETKIRIRAQIEGNL